MKGYNGKVVINNCGIEEKRGTAHTDEGSPKSNDRAYNGKRVIVPEKKQDDKGKQK